MDLIISLGQKNTLAEYMTLFGADNRPPMLDKDLYDSWKSRMELYMQNKEHGRMILESVERGPLIWPTVEENSAIRTKKYAELSVAEKIQANRDMKAINIILQGLPADTYSLVNHHRVAKGLWERVQLLMQVAYQSPQAPTQLMTETPFVDSGFAVPVFSPRDDPIAYLNKAMAFLTLVASLRFPTTNNQLRTSSNPRNQASIQDGRPKRPRNATWYKEKEMLPEAQEARKILVEEQLAFLADPGIPVSQAPTVIPHNAAFQTEDLDTYDSDCDCNTPKNIQRSGIPHGVLLHNTQR
ncbi:hypothetical protein Tco_1556629 [Tanacetum coccineum]